MGLGKTLSMISLVLQTKLDKKRTEKQSDSSEDEAASSRRSKFIPFLIEAFNISQNNFFFFIVFGPLSQNKFEV